MRDLKGKVAVVTGGASGIGRGLCLKLSAEGMKVIVTDIESESAEAVAAEIRAQGGEAVAIQTDVSSRDAVAKLAAFAYEKFGRVQLLCNNAGVVNFRRIQETRYSDWDWTLGVNLHGVINGVQEFLPRMLAQGDEAHIVNTSSICGLVAVGDAGPPAYTAAKFAVVGLTEAMHLDLEGTNVNVSVLCPGAVKTNIVQSQRNRSAELAAGSEAVEITAGIKERHDSLQAVVNTLGSDPLETAQRVIEGVKTNELFIVSHANTIGGVQQRHAALMGAYEREHNTLSAATS